MRIAVVADIHANLPAFTAVLNRVRSMDCEEVFHVGDLIGIGPYPAECIDVARENKVACVTGNHEAWLKTGLPTDAIPIMDENELLHQHWTHSRINRPRRDYVRSFPYRIDRVFGCVRLAFVHFALLPNGNEFISVDHNGMEAEILDAFGGVDSDLICFGHLHNRVMDTEYRGKRFLNPGAAGCFDRPVARFSIVEFSDDAFQVILAEVEYDQGELFQKFYNLEVPDREFIFRVFFGRNEKGEQGVGD